MYSIHHIVDKRTKGQKDKRTKRQKDKRTKGQKDKIFFKNVFKVLCCILGTCRFLLIIPIPSSSTKKVFSSSLSIHFGNFGNFGNLSNYGMLIFDLTFLVATKAG